MDVAAAAGVSPSTASRALSNAPMTRMSDATRQRVLAAAASLGFRANAQAQTLRSGSSMLIGVVVPDIAIAFYAAALKAHPQIPGEIGLGEFGTLHAWLREHIYRHGRKFKPNELVERATGGPMSMGPYLAYLRTKYGQLYRLPQS